MARLEFSRRVLLEAGVIGGLAMLAEACGVKSESHVYGTSNWGETDKRHVLVISGYKEKGGDMAESAGSKTSVSFVELESKGEAGAQVFTGEIIPNLDERAAEIGKMIKAATGKVTVLAYSLGAEELRRALAEKKITDADWEKVDTIMFVNPLSGNEAAKGFGWILGALGIPDTKQFVADVSPWIKKVINKGGRVSVRVSQPELDTMVDTNVVEKVFLAMHGVVVDPEIKRGHGIPQGELNDLIVNGR